MKDRPSVSASTLKGDVRDFLLTWIQSMDTPFHKMKEQQQRDVIWAAEAQAHNLIAAITMAIASHGHPFAFVRISDFTIKDGISSKVTAEATQTTVLNFLDFKGKNAVLCFADPQVYANERRPARYFPDEPDMFTGDDQPEDPPGDGDAGGGAAAKPPKADNSRPGGAKPDVQTRIPQAFTGAVEPEKPEDGDLWRDGSGNIWGRKGGKWVDPKGNERPADTVMPAHDPETGEIKDPPAKSVADLPEGSRDRVHFAGYIHQPPIVGDTFTPAGSKTTFTYWLMDNGSGGGIHQWVDLTTGKVWMGQLGEVDPPATELKPGPAEGATAPNEPKPPKTKPVNNPAPPGSFKDPKTGKADPKDPGEPAEVTDDPNARVLNPPAPSAEPNEDETAEA